MPEAATRARLNTARLAQVHGKRHGCIEMGSSFMARVPSFHNRYNTLTQTIRQRMRKDKSPLHTLNHFETDL